MRVRAARSIIEVMPDPLYSSSKQGVRLFYLDWLRVLATFTLIPYHALEPFGLHIFYIKAAHPSFVFEAAGKVADFWFMPLFFLISGGSVRFALRKRTNKQFKIERRKRLIIPLIFATLILVPLAGYLSDKATYGISNQSFWAYYPTFFRFHNTDLAGFTGTFTLGHLWFLLYLFIFSVICAPLFRAIDKGRYSYIDQLGHIITRLPILIFLSIFILALARATLPFYPSPVYFAFYFILGYLLFAKEWLGEAFHKCFWLAVAIVIILTPIVIAYYTRQTYDDSLRLRVFLFTSVSQRILVELVAFAWVIVFYVLAKRFLNFENRFLIYFRDASIAIYIIHMSVILSFLYVFMRFNLPNIVLFAAVVASSAMVILLFYDIFIRRWSPIRFVFGMRRAKYYC